jgi:signal transduction histidine kinase
MKFPMKSRPVSTVIIILTSIVVIVLAVLQYRWSNQISEATGIRLADSLQMSMINWHSDFFRAFSEICFTMGGGPGGEAGSDLDQYARRYQEWRNVAATPDLISHLYVLNPAANGQNHAFRLNRTTRRFEPVEWPAELDSLLEVLRRAPPMPASGTPGSDIDRGMPAALPDTPDQEFADRFYPVSPLAGWRFESTIPALLHPIAGSTRTSSTGPSEGRDTQDWIVIELNRKTIEEHVLPELAQRYFQGTNGLDYQVAVVARSPRRHVMYSSDSDFANEDVPDADGTMDVFGRVQDHTLGSPIQIFHKPSQNKGSAALAGISWFPLLRDIPENQDWRLIVRHRRGGSLGAFVAEMRRRNLAISFGVLFLLVICVAMLIVASNRAQRFAKLQMDFVTAVSHELRTPLTVISSAADNIAHGVVGGKQQLAQYGSVIGNQARKLSGLVEQILLFAAIREGHQRYALRALKVREIIDAALASTSGLLQEARFEVEQEVAPDLPPVLGDLPALSRCLQNLITNALKYGAEQRWIGICARALEQGPNGKEVQISVEDRGMGIDSSDLPHIFEPFYRSPLVAAAQIHGTGLGLPLVRSIVEAMKGYLTVTSVPGRGSTFTIHLPAADQPTQGASEELSTVVTS